MHFKRKENDEDFIHLQSSVRKLKLATIKCVSPNDKGSKLTFRVYEFHWRGNAIKAGCWSGRRLNSIENHRRPKRPTDQTLP